MHSMTIGRYSRSPLVEAILDFQVEVPEDRGPSDLAQCRDAAYPEGKSLPPPQKGVLQASGDGKQLFQARSDGLTVHRLAPYQGWTPFREEVRRLWEIYRRTIRPRKVERVALRYINRLDLPFPIAEIKDYLRTSPDVSPDLPQGLAGFFMELNIPQPDLRCTLLLRETVVSPALPGMASVILDLDLFRTEAIPSEEADLWAFLDCLRIRQNAIFEACITDRMRERIQ